MLVTAYEAGTAADTTVDVTRWDGCGTGDPEEEGIEHEGDEGGEREETQYAILMDRRAHTVAGLIHRPPRTPSKRGKSIEPAGDAVSKKEVEEEERRSKHGMEGW